MALDFPAWGNIMIVALIALTGPGGHHIYLNPHEVSSLRDDHDPEHVAKGIKCLVIMTNGKANGVREDCATVQRTVDTGHRSNVGQPPCTLVCAGQR